MISNMLVSELSSNRKAMAEGQSDVSIFIRLHTTISLPVWAQVFSFLSLGEVSILTWSVK